MTLTRTLRASIHDVFVAWTDPRLMLRWLAPGDYTVRAARSDAYLGGHYRIEVQGPGGDTHINTGEYRELVPDRRIVQTWEYQGPHDWVRQESSLLTVELRSIGSDLTEMTLTHENLRNSETRARQEENWAGCLRKLEDVLCDPLQQVRRRTWK